MNIILGITGSIAAYKALDLLRELQREGYHVKVVCTERALNFVGMASLKGLCESMVFSAQNDFDAQGNMLHIELAKWADLLLVAPASANMLAKVAQGLSDDLLSNIILAAKAPLYLAPAMNQAMWAHEATQHNLTLLQRKRVTLIGPVMGEQACGDVGLGRMAPLPEIIEVVNSRLLAPILKGKRVLISAGPTQEYLDPVRFISNVSSGKMGYALANAARLLGAEVTLVSGPTALMTPPVNVVRVTSAKAMCEAVLAELPQADIFISAAAVADFSPAELSAVKIKKTSSDIMTLSLSKNPDIVATAKRVFPTVFCVGFAAETNDVIHYAERKLSEKGLDMMVANQVGEGKGAMVDTNQVTLMDRAKHKVTIAETSKIKLAFHILEFIQARFNRRH